MQSKLGSFVEAVVNTLVGLAVAFTAQLSIAHAYDIPLTPKQSFIIVAWMTVISVFRSYVIRRLWNGQFWRVFRRG